MSLFTSISVAQTGLSASQAAISVVSNNIANVDTAGYSKLKVNQSSVINYTPSAGNTTSQANSLGGTQIDNISRYSNSYLQNYYWRENSSYNYMNEYSSIASNVQDLTNELKTTGLSTALTSFYSAVNALNSSPSDVTARQNFVDQAQNVCSVFNSMSSSLSNVQKELVGDPTVAGSIESSKISSSVDDVNGLLKQISEVNNDIIKTNSGGVASPALLDQRDSLITKLSALMPVKVTEHSNSTVDVSLGDYDLVNGAKNTGFLKVNSGSTDEPAVVSIVDSDNNTTATDVNSSITGGTIGAMLSVTGKASSDNFTISGVIKNLDTLANSFATTLNNIQTGKITTTNTDGSTTTTTPLAIDKTTLKLIDASTDLTKFTLFKSDDATNTTINASNISVNSTIVSDPYLVAAARLDTSSSTYSSSSTGNASNVALITKARSTTNNDLNHQTVEDYLSNMVTNVGNDVKNLTTSTTNEKLVLTQVQTSLQNATGVDMNEELVDLMKYQRAYQASARVFSTCSSLLEELVNLGK